MRKKWMKIWEQNKSRLSKLPLEIQKIILDDINTAVKNRISAMERTQHA